MKALNHYITEKFQVSKDYKRQYTYQPKDKKELIKIIKEKIYKEGFGTEDEPLDLNDIDTSKITDMSNLFDADDGELKVLAKSGYFDISDWDVSNVKDMEYMFYYSAFDGDISDWDVSKVENMHAMFYDSKFNGDISRWNVSNVKNIRTMFWHSKFSGNISDWDVRNVKDMQYMFYSCPLQKNPPKWYKK